MATRPENIPENIPEEVWEGLTDEYKEAISSVGKTDYKDSPFYKNGSKEDRLEMDTLHSMGKDEEINKHLQAIADGNAKTFAEAVEYNANIDAQQESITQDSDKVSAGLTLANTVAGMGTAMAMRNRGDKELDKRTKEILGNVAPTIEKSQALTNALGQAQYQAGAGMPSEIQGAINEQDRYDYENALDQVRGASNQGNNAMNNLMFNNALRANRNQAQMDLQYRNQALQNRNNLIASDQAINTAQGGINAQNNMAKLAFLNKRAERAAELKESGLMGALNKGNELASGAANAYKLARTINARNAILNQGTPVPNDIIMNDKSNPNYNTQKASDFFIRKKAVPEERELKYFDKIETPKSYGTIQLPNGQTNEYSQGKYSGLKGSPEIPWYMEAGNDLNSISDYYKEGLGRTFNY